MPKNKGKRTMSDQNEKLLVVEDTFLIAMQLQMDLKSLGYSVAGPAPSVERAFKILDREPVKAALLDVHLGNENSIPICLLYTSPSPRDATLSRMPSSA